ncbi:glycosyl hydrolase [Streptomyces tubercidicus]
MNDVLDLHLDDLVPADADSEYAEKGFWPCDLTVMAEYHTTDGSHSYVVAHDRSVTWGVPGEPQVVAIKVTRDLSLSTFTLDTAYHAMVPFAQNWLIERGCPPERIAPVGDDFVKPADDLTVRIEQQVRGSGTRYQVLDSRTWDIGPYENWALTRDCNAGQAPIRLFLNEWGHGPGTYTMREGAFADEDAARCWLDDRSSPLPQPPEYRGEVTTLRTRAALTRSSGASAISMAAFDAHHTPPAGTAHRPNPGRSM